MLLKNNNIYLLLLPLKHLFHPSSPPVIDKYKYKDKLPADIVPYKELDEKYNVNIYNSPNVKFHFRRAALSKLKFFEWTSKPFIFRDEEIKRKINIFIVDGPVVHPYYLTEDQRQATKIPRFQQYKPLTEEQVQQEKDNLIQGVNEDTQRRTLELKDQLQAGEISEQKYIEKLAELNKTHQFAIDEFSTIKDEEDLLLQTNRYQGQNLPVLRMSDNTTDIFICVGYIPPKEKSPDYYRQKGLRTKPLTVDQSFTSPDDLKVDLNKPAYVIGPQTVPFIGRHELKHPDIDMGLGADLNKVERTVDLQAYQDIQEAYEQLLNGDDSLYWEVFETPNGNVITKNIASGILASL